MQVTMKGADGGDLVAQIAEATFDAQPVEVGNAVLFGWDAQKAHPLEA
ncbi:hypothetical protein ABTD18_19890 [Acinetobacter baumannii]